MKNLKLKIDTLIAVIELTEHKVGLETLKEISTDLEEAFKLRDEQIKQAIKDFGFIDWNTCTFDQLVHYLEDKYRFSSTADAYCIYKLIEYYKNNKQ